ncbi:ROK family transcriptional regulator [Asticcacaulis sp. 201]|uniref:ROK family transcriptional regulator n=1 Tax=Asticcacaulis sp. 201 TaxID=3028787 RepID=UPI002916CCD2|nr:ROK family transcriptional regulator [Asticcacaulis sp. 201]MDV6333057.1 ROK family transcriptional regulator [Asticcacaulis sp. 201]
MRPTHAERQKTPPHDRTVSDGGRLVLDRLLKSGGLSQADITRSLALAQPTVARLLQGFQQDGMISVSHRNVDRPGNPSVHVTLAPDFAYSLGISMQGDALIMVVMDFTGHILSVRSAAMPSMSRQAVLETLTRFKSELITETGIERDRLIGAGVGISAFFWEDGGLMAPNTHLKDWANVEIASLIEDELNLPVCLGNDGTVAAISESLFGIGRTVADFVYLHLSNGFGGGIISHGKAFHGFHGNAGEFGGVWNIVGDGYPNLDLMRTCLAAKGHAFATVEDMVQRIDMSWEGVEDWLAQAVTPFTKLAKVLAYVLDPQTVVIGGRLPADIAETLIQRMDVTAMDDRYFRPYPMPQIVQSQISNHHAVAMGAAAMPLQKAFFI